MDERIQRTLKRWYIQENALFQVMCTHDIVENKNMHCSMRSGRARLEVNPYYLAQLSDVQLESSLRAEAIRILLKHPYERRPFGCQSKTITMGSNLVLADNYNFDLIGLRSPTYYGLSPQQAYEWYAQHINDKANDDGADRFSTDTSDEQKEQEAAYTAAGEGDGRAESGNNPGGSQSQIDSQGQQSQLKNEQQQVGKQPETLDASPHEEPEKRETPHEQSANELKEDHKPNQGQTGESQQTDEESLIDEEDYYDEYDNPDGKPREETEVGEPGAEPTSGRSEEELHDSSALWEEDIAMQHTIETAIEKIEASQSWGSLSADLVSLIIANSSARLDYRKVLSGFRASVLSAARSLTRMRPNRRSGFDAMGSVRRLTTKLLVAIDVSGSVGDSEVKHFFSVVNRAFRYGIEEIDLITFDNQLSEVYTFSKARKYVKIHGRGGTDFQQVFDFVDQKKCYDGVLIFTDGFAPAPRQKTRRTKVLWVCATEAQLNKHQAWMKQTGRVCSIHV